MKKSVVFVLSLLLLINVSLVAETSSFADIKVADGKFIYNGNEFTTLALVYSNVLNFKANSINSISIVNDKNVGSILRIDFTEGLIEIEMSKIKNIVSNTKQKFLYINM